MLRAARARSPASISGLARHPTGAPFGASADAPPALFESAFSANAARCHVIHLAASAAWPAGSSPATSVFPSSRKNARAGGSTSRSSHATATAATAAARSETETHVGVTSESFKTPHATRNNVSSSSSSSSSSSRFLFFLLPVS